MLRKKIQENLSNEITQINNRVDVLEQTYNIQHKQLLNTQNKELSTTENFAEFQRLNQEYFNQRIQHSNEYIEKTKSIIQGLNKAENYLEPLNPNEELVLIQINETSFQKPLSFYSSMKLCSALNIFPNPTSLKQVEINDNVILSLLPAIDQIATRPQYIVSLFNIKDQQIVDNSKEFEW